MEVSCEGKGRGVVLVSGSCIWKCNVNGKVEGWSLSVVHLHRSITGRER